VPNVCVINSAVSRNAQIDASTTPGVGPAVGAASLHSTNGDRVTQGARFIGVAVLMRLAVSPSVTDAKSAPTTSNDVVIS
jgi:hypothetical protein